MKEAANDSGAVLHERDPCRGNKDMSDRPAATFDLDQLLHPAQAFGHPSEVVNDPDLTTHEKRAILSSWVSDDRHGRLDTGLPLGKLPAPKAVVEVARAAR